MMFINRFLIVCICGQFLGLYGDNALANNVDSDEFVQVMDLIANNTSNWSVLGTGNSDIRADQITINNGWLTVIPEVFSQNAWFQDEYGPLIYKEITGNFSVATRLRVVSSDDNNSPPNLGFNAGGFVIRDADGTHQGNENWVMYNMGGQGMNGVTYAREVKKTRHSISNLFLTEQVELEEYLLVCRVGQDFFFYYWADSINGWREERLYNQFPVDGNITTTWRNSSSVTPEVPDVVPGESGPLFFSHDLMPSVVQVGIMGHAWENSDTQADFDFVRFAKKSPQAKSDCLTEFQFLGHDLIFVDGFN